ncbi:hypothetical protein BKA82DRAFT_529659 [Pisolithus tinctorius]|uniref:Secreted protein n=1 Tax=Pisolithus tinctorius Marx 270 TaxID=870435 RepID=A0A0C3J7E7_PISTI|nr:hypothetical protein BKA82DRAFT_529659 [Pisolithus tinctorius]KIO04968.1 hypothetical protein M404DRAFT_529659 [Pisolithus tinctorius Marx 270]
MGLRFLVVFVLGASRSAQRAFGIFKWRSFLLRRHILLAQTDYTIQSLDLPRRRGLSTSHTLYSNGVTSKKNAHTRVAGNQPA